MAFRMWYSDGPGGAYAELDFASTACVIERLQGAYSHPYRLNFLIHAASHTKPIKDRSHIILVDENYSASMALPIFEGHVWEINPKGPFQIEYVCFDVTMRARNEITIMSGPHADPTVIPRLVYNSKIDNDDDRAFELRHHANVGRIIADLMTHAYNELHTNCQAAPPTFVGGDAFEMSDLTSLDFVPQEKMTFESEQLGQGLERLLNYYPHYRIVFFPGISLTLRKWRFLDVTSAPQVTLTLNKFTETHKVLSMSLARSIEQRFTAVKIYGPPKTVVDLVYQQDDPSTGSVVETGLAKLWTMQAEINFGILGPWGMKPAIGNAGKQWQVTDTTKRRLAKILPYEVFIPSSEFNVAGTELLFKRTRQPTLQVTFDNCNTWWTVNGIILDAANGLITAPNHVFQYTSGSYMLPDNARFYFAYYDVPLSVRYPSSSYTGTAYTVAGLAVEKKLYDEQLCVGYEAGPSMSQADRSAQYAKLAESLVKSTKDIIYTGVVVLQGIQYDFLRLWRRINITAVDKNGQAQTTGWEAINAILTDVEYNYSDMTTTLTLGSDQMEFTQQDSEQLKAMLGIEALENQTAIDNGNTLTLNQGIAIAQGNAFNAKLFEVIR